MVLRTPTFSARSSAKRTHCTPIFSPALFFQRRKYCRRGYLNNRVFLSRNYRLIVAPRKFDVLKTNICPKSEASRANMLVLKASNFQGATIRPINPRQTLYCLYCSLNFLPRASSKIMLNYFQLYETKAVSANVKFEKENKQKPF